MRLPEDLQSRLKQLLDEKSVLEAQIKDVRHQIKERRKSCSHEPIPGTEDHYATYCRLCGFMMDTWL